MNEQVSVNAGSKRLHYLDWLQVLAILGVFIFHSFHPFDDLFPWHIKNAESSIVANVYIGLFAFWGMPFFFMLAGATTWFSLRQRSPGRYLRERVSRLLVPFILGSIVLTPIQAYFELTHKRVMSGVSFVDFITSPKAPTYYFTEFRPLSFDPGVFGDFGYHLWFVGFLFAFALIALPVFIWLKGDPGQRFLASLARLAAWRVSLLTFVIPSILIRVLLLTAFPAEEDWANFLLLLFFFVSGYILFTDERFMQAIRRDWLHYLILGVACTLFVFSALFGVPVFDWIGSPGTPGFYLAWIVIGVNAWCWTMFMIYIGMRFLDFTNNWLQYGREASYPFFFIHQPVIIFVAFYVVQWQAPLLLKLLVVVLGSFALSLGIYELLIRRISPVRRLFGMKSHPR